RRAAQVSVRTELPRRHAVADAELLAEVVLRIEAAAARDLGDAQIAALEQPCRLLEPLLFQKLAQEPSGDSMKAAGDVLPRIAELLRHRFHRYLFVGTKTPAHCFDERTQEAVHTLLLRLRQWLMTVRPEVLSGARDQLFLDGRIVTQRYFFVHRFASRSRNLAMTPLNSRSRSMSREFARQTRTKIVSAISSPISPASSPAFGFLPP